MKYAIGIKLLATERLFDDFPAFPTFSLAWQEKPAKQRQKDVDARWTKKNEDAHYGYKSHVNADAANKLVQSYAVSDAAVA